MSGFLQRLMPQEVDFFVLFQKQAENIVSGAAALTKMLEHYTGVPEQAQAIKAIEHCGDEITHQIFRRLNRPSSRRLIAKISTNCAAPWTT